MEQLSDAWEAAAAPPDRHPEPSALDGLDWLPARVPGTAAAALHDARLWRPGEPSDLDAQDWWFRTRFAADPPRDDEQLLLRLDGIATVAEAFLNGERILESSSMWERHALDVGARVRAGENELAIRCRALAPLLAEPRKPRARWRTRLVDGNLRWYRTMLLGRAPGFAPGPAAVGPWRPVRLDRRGRGAVERLELRPRLEDGDGVLAVRAEVLGDAALEIEAAGRRASLAGGTAELTLPSVEPWWPHTHGEPALHTATLLADGEPVATRRIGFRRLEASDPEHGLSLSVNGVRVFARGAVWTPVDPVSLAPSATEVRRMLEGVRDAGMNVLRIPGTSCYESELFHDLCDELGLLVWQDFMFANLDYPITDAGFRSQVEREARDVLERLAGRPSLVVLCGNSEVEQQVAMLGLDPALGRGELFGELLPTWAREAGADAVYVPSAPTGGELPFHPRRGVAHYFGVGGYRRGLDDTRRAAVRFAAECLAFANVPDRDVADGEGVPSDAGVDWDFADVRDHYLALRFGVAPSALRAADRTRYLELSRAVTGEVMAEVFGEWRRAGSECAGGIVLWLRDLVPGAGWGVVDSCGEPKVAWHHLRRALQPVSVWTTDEGMNGVDVHVANDGATPLDARLRVALYRDFEVRVDAGEEELELAAHGACTRSVESVLGRFVDAAWAYRFGPPGHDTIVASLERDGRLLSQAFRFPVGPPLEREPLDRLGLEADAAPLRDGTVRLTVRTRRLAYGVRVHVAGHVPADDAFTLEPGSERVIELRPRDGAAYAGCTLTALNLDGAVRASAAAEAA